jgi:hypothetical protein
VAVKLKVRCAKENIMGIRETVTKIKRRFTDEDDELPAYKTNRDVAREGIAEDKKAKYLKRYGEGLKDSLDIFKRRGDLEVEMGRTVSPEGQGFEEMKDAIRSERKRAGLPTENMKKGGAVKKMSSGGKVSSASKRADGIAVKGKTRGKIC